MSIHSLKAYKESKILLPDIEKIIQVLDLTERALVNFTHYLPAYKVLVAARDQRIMLEIVRKELVATKDSKGKRV